MLCHTSPLPLSCSSFIPSVIKNFFYLALLLFVYCSLTSRLSLFSPFLQCFFRSPLSREKFVACVCVFAIFGASFSFFLQALFFSKLANRAQLIAQTNRRKGKRSTTTEQVAATSSPHGKRVGHLLFRHVLLFSFVSSALLAPPCLSSPSFSLCESELNVLLAPFLCVPVISFSVFTRRARSADRQSPTTLRFSIL